MIVPRFWKDQNEWFVSKKQNDPLKKTLRKRSFL